MTDHELDYEIKMGKYRVWKRHFLQWAVKWLVIAATLIAAYAIFLYVLEVNG